MLNNSSTKSIGFTVSDSIMVQLTDVYNYPNPFAGETWFSFRHNQFGSELTFTIQIFDIHGQLVKTIGPETTINNGYLIEPIRWDGESDGGSKLNPGFYVYVLKVENPLGFLAKQVQKLVITH
jgi:flagellar hook assembly protein FlgD